MCPERGLQHEADAGSLSAETSRSVQHLLPNEAFHSSRCDLASYRLSGPLVPTPSALEVFTDALGFEPCKSPREGRGMLARGRTCRLSGEGPYTCPESAHCWGHVNDSSGGGPASTFTHVLGLSGETTSCQIGLEAVLLDHSLRGVLMWFWGT